MERDLDFTRLAGWKRVFERIREQFMQDEPTGWA